ncbi:ornithine carbamoyltransferase [Buchnera aphidicola (Kurisakia onigurumii)]|uniref:ornithine carbamoyltransferase n=1 Tax=Buchnera aphidicola TaxID=9 RepID=UPI0031B73B29
MQSLHKKNFLKFSDFTQLEIEKILNFSIFLKNKKNKNKEIQYLKNKNILLIFEKESTRTRCSFEVAASDQGAYTSLIQPGDSHINDKESIQDSIYFFNRIYDGIQYRGKNHETVELMSKYSQIPIWNGLTETFHPTQLLADLLTIKEYTKNKEWNEITCAYIGDAKNNICNTLLDAAGVINFNLNIISPKNLSPNEKMLKICKKKSNKINGKILCTHEIQEGIHNADFIYTDVWVSMNTPTIEWKNRINLLKKYQINKKNLSCAKKEVKIMHCLPSLHDMNTNIGKKIIKENNLYGGIEITDEIFQKNKKIIFDQAENRMHTIKSLIISTIKKIKIIKKKLKIQYLEII